MQALRLRAISNGLAMFSMFFGAGNVIFPLMIGQSIGSGNLIFALLGLIVTAVLIPFSGLISITLFEGDYFKFFNRIGKVPGFIIILFLLGLIGPFGGIPRCVALTFSTMKVYFPGIKIFWFSFVSCGVIFVCCWKKNRVLDILGLVLTPLLLIFLLVIITKAVLFSHSSADVTIAKGNAFIYGLKEGYNTMDLLATFFFSSIICSRLRVDGGDSKTVIRHAINACGIGAALLALVYVGFSFAAAFYRGDLASIPSDQLLGALGQVILGPAAGFMVSMTVLLSCLTTSIALTVVCSEFLKSKILKDKLKYEWSLIVILFGSLLVSTLEFSGIVRTLFPILQICYPSLVVMSFLNIMYKLLGVNMIKSPVAIVFLLALINGFFL